jgi:hypothetical protein
MSDCNQIDKKALDRWITREDTGHYPQCKECPISECDAAPESDECKKHRAALKEYRNCYKWGFHPADCPLRDGPECPATCSEYDDIRCDEGNDNCTPVACYDCLKNPDNQPIKKEG